ncbi:MAG TPA: hypothetical protein VFU73_11395 [Actinocrinis sp.]|nr:hypothetical protein [Actinocrinis sp.]
MSAGWVAGTVRARELLTCAIGVAGTSRLAEAPTLAAAAAELAGTAYQHLLPEDASAAQAERAVEDTALWNLRVLAGWLPRTGVAVLRVVAADFEIRNVADKLRALAAGPVVAPYRLGAPATAWGRASSATSLAELRGIVSASPWGRCESDTPADLVADLRLSGAVRLAALHTATRPWGAAAAALAIARQRFLIGRPLAPATRARAAQVLGIAAVDAEDWNAFNALLPKPNARWVMEGIDDSARLWVAEERWWARVESDARALAHAPGFGMEPALGCAVVLLADARAVRGALCTAARGGRGPLGADRDVGE